MAFPVSPVDGQTYKKYKYNSTNGSWERNDGKVLSLHHVQCDTDITTSSISYVDLPGASITLTPSSVDSKFFLSTNVHFYAPADSANKWYAVRVRLVRDTTSLRADDDYGLGNYTGDASERVMVRGNFTYLDSPNTTAPITYKVQIASKFAGDSIRINQYSPGDFTITELAE